jgi:hypothetical protein
LLYFFKAAGSVTSTSAMTQPGGVLTCCA